MSSLSPRLWPVRLTTLVLWALAAASAVAWGMRLANPVAPAAALAAPPALAAPDAQAIARLLGAVSATQPVPGAVTKTDSRYALVGVLTDRDGTHGAALIAVAGQPAKPFRVGANVDGDLVLQALGPREARLGLADAAATLTLALPAER
ncbi:MAG: type II secretion system protein N [Giesbergeria sp.]